MATYTGLQFFRGHSVDMWWQQTDRQTDISIT